MRVRNTPSKVAFRIVGIDASLTSTGYAYREASQLQTGLIKSKYRGMQRLEHNLNQFKQMLDAATPQIAIYEGYSMGSRGNNTFNIGELGGQYQLELYLRRTPVILVPPKTLKLAIAGNGNAGKPEMAEAVEEFYGVTGLGEDETDAYALMVFGEALIAGTGPAQVVKRVLQARPKIELVYGKGSKELQTVAKLASVG